MVDIVVGRDDTDLAKFGHEGTILLGRHIVGTGEEVHLTTPLILDILRPHCIVVTGKRGEGKCLDKNSLVRMEDNSLVPIKDIESIGKRILALNEEGRIVPAEKTNFYRRTVNEMLQIKLENGYEITLTPEHPLLTKEGWKPSHELDIGTEIAVSNNTQVSNGNSVLIQNQVTLKKILEIKKLEGEFEVYDISVPEHHNFIANDIIVHNSYSLGVMVEELAKLPQRTRKNLCSLVIDTQGIFWTMKTPNDKEYAALNAWNLDPVAFPFYVYVPEGQGDLFLSSGVEFDGTFSIQPSQLSSEDWLSVFHIDDNDPQGILLQKAFRRLHGKYGIDDIINTIQKEEGFSNEKLALQNRFAAAREWGVFGSEKMPEILEPGKTTILDVSMTPQNVRALLVSIICKKILEERIRARRKEELIETNLESLERVPMPWIFIDEAHNFYPSEGKTAASEILGKLVREGRQPGITMLFATQQPERLNVEALSQSDIVLSFRLTAKVDIDALKAIMQTYLLYDITKYINELPRVKGAAIILDDNSERIYKVRLRPRQSWHAGSSPLAI